MKKTKNIKNSLIYDNKGTIQVSEQIMNAYNSGSINKEGLHGDLGNAAHYK
jgi:hypothetical protein